MNMTRFKVNNRIMTMNMKMKMNKKAAGGAIV